MVRRKTINSTGNKSRRLNDAQIIYESSPVIITPIQDKFVIFSLPQFSITKDSFLIAGFYAKITDGATHTKLNFSFNGYREESEIELDTKWKRFFYFLHISHCVGEPLLRIELPSNGILFWGVNIEIFDSNLLDKYLDIKLPISDKEIIDFFKNATIIPEIAYMDHSKPLVNVKIKNEINLNINKSKEHIFLKYCSLCDRLLPARGESNEAISFHKHKPQLNGSFKSGYQQECRACKNKNINRKLNPKRTPDQFFESSLLHRERKIFLEDPKFYNEIQNKYKGDLYGFKKAIWLKFNKKCFNCGKTIKLNETELDHTRPMSLFWPLDEYATCLCKSCNNSKHDKLPSEFYSDQKLKSLSKITGLPFSELKNSKFNPKMLKEITKNIEKYANSWSPNFFNNTREKILEYYPNIDILKIYEEKTGKTYKKRVIKT